MFFRNMASDRQNYFHLKKQTNKQTNHGELGYYTQNSIPKTKFLSTNGILTFTPIKLLLCTHFNNTVIIVIALVTKQTAKHFCPTGKKRKNRKNGAVPMHCKKAIITCCLFFFFLLELFGFVKMSSQFGLLYQNGKRGLAIYQCQFREWLKSA